MGNAQGTNSIIAALASAVRPALAIVFVALLAGATDANQEKNCLFVRTGPLGKSDRWEVIGRGGRG